MIKPTAADIGRKVVYRQFWEQDRRTGPPKEAMIIGLDDPYVTIKFRDGVYDLARPRDLEWAP